MRLVVQHPLQTPQPQIQERPDPARNGFEVPDMRYGDRQLDVPHALPTNLALRDLHTAAVADHTPVADPLVLPTIALPISCWPEDPLAEQPISLGSERPIVDGLGLGHLPARPLPDLLRGGQLDLDPTEIVLGRFRCKHVNPPFGFWIPDFGFRMLRSTIRNPPSPNTYSSLRCLKPRPGPSSATPSRVH